MSRRAAPSHLVISWLLLLLAGATGPARASELTDARAALEGKTAEALDALATWCTKKRLFGKRDETYALLLEFDPEHEAARKKLRYTKDENGAWVQDPKFKLGTNWSRSALPEHEKRLAAILDAYRAGQLALYARASSIADLLWARRELTAYMHRYPEDERPGPLLRNVGMKYYEAARDRGLVQEMVETASQLRALHPEDVDVRTALGETKHEGRWMLLESARYLSDAAGLDAVVERTLRRMGRPKTAEPREVEAKIALPWKPGAATADVRAMGTVEEEHLRKIATRCQAAGPLFEAALGAAPSRRAGLTLYVFGEKGELDSFLAGYPVVDNPSLQQREKLKLDLVYVDAYGMALKANPPDAQLDLAVNTVLNQVFSDTFLGSEDCRGWHAEGISRYLAFKLLGTRLSINVVGRYAGQGGDRHVPESKEDWLAYAHGLLSRSEHVGLALMLGKGVDVFDVRDAVVSYAFAIYLLEGHEGLAAPFVRAVVRTADVDEACREILGMPLPVLEHRFRTWLEQVTEPKGPTK